MLQITIPGMELYDEAKDEFVTTKPTTISLEHSLLSVSKWESKWHVPFLSKQDKTKEQVIDYIRCMTVTPNVDPYVYEGLTPKLMAVVNAYITDPMTATTFNDRNQRPSREIVTSEIIYYSMTEYGIPFECQKWHLNRLLTLIHVCSAKNAPKKKMGKRDILSQNAQLNAMRRAKMGSRG